MLIDKLLSLGLLRLSIISKSKRWHTEDFGETTNNMNVMKELTVTCL